jgi:hypothetical protein
MRSLSQIALELAREPGHPLGDREHGYHLYLPLTSDGRIDDIGWKGRESVCRVRAFRPGEPPALGRIVHDRAGHWRGELSREGTVRMFRLKADTFVPGETVSIHEDDGSTHTFQVLSVRAA